MKRVDVDPLTNLLIVRYRFLKRDKKEKELTKKRVRTLENRIFSKGTGVWIVPPDYANIKNLWDWGFIFPEDWAFLANGAVKIKKKPAIMPYHSINVPRYLKFLRPYQKEAVQFLEWNNGRGIIGDEMGTGKTVEALGFIKWNIGEGPALIIVPSVTKPQWVNSFKKWVGNAVEVLQGKTSHPLIEQSYVINWAILKEWEEVLSKVHFATVIADECQYVSNPGALRTKSFLRIARRIPYIIPMSGTPIESKTRQFFTVLHLVNPKLFPSEWKFWNRYCGPKHNGFAVTYDGASHTEELFNKISECMIRRRKRDVLKDLPPLIRTVLPLDLGAALKQYKKVEEVFYDTYDIHSVGTTQLDKDLRTMKMLIFDWKLPAIKMWIDDFLLSGKKLVIGAWHHHVIDTLSANYKGRCVSVSGKVTGKKREEALKNFYNKVDILILQLKAGGVGLDGLQDVCSDAAIVELGTTPTIMDQFESRLERSGQKNPMTMTYLVGQGTIEEDLIESLDVVRENISATVDGEKASNKNLLTVLFERRLYGDE